MLISFFGMQLNSWCFPSLKVFFVTGNFSLTENKWFLRFCICVCTVKRDQINESFRDFLLDWRWFEMFCSRVFAGGGGSVWRSRKAFPWANLLCTSCCTVNTVHHCFWTPLLLYTTIGVHHCTPLGPTCCKRTPPSHPHRQQLYTAEGTLHQTELFYHHSPHSIILNPILVVLGFFNDTFQ